MPPRKSAGFPAKRATRATARKSIPKPSSKSLPSKDLSESLPANPSEITIATSPQATPNSSDKPSPTILSESLPAKTPEITSLPSPKISAPEIPSKGVAKNAHKVEAKVTAPATSDGTLGDMAPTPPETNVVEAAEKAAITVVLAPPPEAAATGSSVPENVAKPKTVVKKTVRIVKKVVKKKKLVPKRVEKGLIDCSNKESEKTDIAGDTKRSNAVVSGSVEVGNPTSSGIDSMEVDKNNSSVSVAMEVENASNPGVKNPNSSVSASLEVEDLNKSKVCEGEKCVSEAPVSDSTGDQKNGDVVERTNSDNGVLVEAANAVSVGSGNGENVESGGGGDVEVKEEVENSDVGGFKGKVEVGNEFVVLSEEMEALERRKRRKTEIFIGGLDKDAKEEDIRKVFEEVGEVVEVRLMMNSHTGKNKGYAFLRYALAADAKKALEQYPKVEICGKQCGTAPVDGNDTIFLGDIDRKWKDEDVIKLLQEIGIEKIDKITVMADPNNTVCNRGFAFLELETSKDAQNAYKKLQKKDVFGKHHKIKVAWAEPLNEPDEEEMLKVKSVYAEFIPSSWDEEKVRDYFSKFGDIDNIVLARNLRSSKRKDFAFVNYTTREAALACTESFSHELSNDEGSKVNVKVSLAKPIPKSKQNKQVSNPISKESFKEKPKVAQRGIKPNDSRNKGKSTRSNYGDRKGDRRYSTNDRPVQFSRERASWGHSQTGLGIGSVNRDYSYTLPGRKRPYSALEDDPLYSDYSDLRGYPRTRFGTSYPVASPSYNALSQGVGMTSLPYYQQQGAGYASGSPYGITDHSSSMQREGASYQGSSRLYYRY